MAIQPGALDQRITIEQPTNGQDSNGSTTRSWSALATVWARVLPLSGRERAMLAEVEAPASYRFTIRRRGDLADDMRITWNGATYNIRFIADPGGRDLYISIDAERGVA